MTETEWTPDWKKAERKVKEKTIRKMMARLRGGRPRSQISDKVIRERALERLGSYYRT